MRKSISVAAMVLLALAIAVQLGSSPGSTTASNQQQFAATSVWGSVSSPILAAPGSSNLPLTVSVVNLGPDSVYNVTLSIIASGPLSTVRGEPQNVSEFLPAFSVGSSAVLVGFYNTSATAAPGLYNQTVAVEYSNLFGNVTSSKTLNVVVPILGNPSIELSGYEYTPVSIYPGYTAAELVVTLVNSGSTAASDVNVTLLPSNPVYSISQGSLTHFLGLMPIGVPIQVPFELGIQNSSESINSTLSLEVGYNSGQLASFSVPFVEDPVAQVTVESVSTPTVHVGDGGDYISVTVKNTGQAPILFGEMTMLPSSVFQPSIPSTESPLLAVTFVNSSLGTVAPGQSATATYILQVSSKIQAGTYPLTFIVSWSQQGSRAPFATEVTVPITVQNTQTQDLSSFISKNILLVILVVLVAIVVVIVAIVAAVRGRRKPESKP